MTTEYATIRYETTDTGIARVTLAMPEKRNAQTLELLSEFNDALDKAAQDDAIKVIVTTTRTQYRQYSVASELPIVRWYSFLLEDDCMLPSHRSSSIL